MLSSLLPKGAVKNFQIPNKPFPEWFQTSRSKLKTVFESTIPNLTVNTELRRAV